MFLPHKPLHPQPNHPSTNFSSSLQVHNLDTAPPTETTATEEELLDYFKTMYTMRRMEITCDNEYKVSK